MKIPRAPWPEDFPQVVLHTNVKTRDAHPDYAAAKSGDAAAAVALSQALMRPDTVAVFESIVTRCSNPVLLPIHAEEQDGFNAIPVGMTQWLASALNLRIDDNIVQVNKVAHTRADGFTRLARQPQFDGKVEKGTEYLIVDDHFGLGGTIANLRGYVMAREAKVVIATTLTASRANDIIALTGPTRAALHDRFGSTLNVYLEEKFGFAADCLTEPEGNYLLRVADVDVIRDRIAAAEGG